MTSTVARSWSVIESWLKEHAPGTALGLQPQEPTAQAQVEAYLGQLVPEDVADYLRVVPWSSTRDGLLGLHSPIRASDMVAESALQVQIGDDVLADFPVPGSQAGTPEHRFSPVFLRITSDGGGNALFVDLRPGPQQGRVTEWDKVDGSHSAEPQEWSSVAAMLEDLATCLGTGRPFMRYFKPVAADDALDWIFTV